MTVVEYGYMTVFRDGSTKAGKAFNIFTTIPLPVQSDAICTLGLKA